MVLTFWFQFKIEVVNKAFFDNFSLYYNNIINIIFIFHYMNYIKFYLVIIKILSFINVLNIQIIFGHISIQKNETFENIFNRNGQLFFP